MQTTITQQMAAIKLAMQTRAAVLLNNYYGYAKDKQWVALNDAYSTLVAVKNNWISSSEVTRFKG